MWYSGLNPEQQRAVAHNYGPLLILAGAGSGKTTVLVSRTGRMIAEGVAKAEQILVLTFTNKAARELKHRVSVKVGKSAKKISAGTFHSFGLQLIKKYHKELELDENFGIIDTSDTFAILKEMLKEIKVVGRDKYDLEHLYGLIQNIRNKKHNSTIDDEYHQMAEILAPKYEKRLNLLSVVDFESLLLKPLELFNKFPHIKAEVQAQYKQIMVDEFQDTNATQMKLINHLIGQHDNLSVVGDDDQSIYGWRGAEVQNILSFPKSHKNCEVIKLERNYRSISSILHFANDVISKNKSRHGKILKSESKKVKDHIPELFILENEEAESEFIASEILSFVKEGYKAKDIAILYRSNSQGAWLESALKKNRIEYTITGGSSLFERKEVKDLVAFIRQAIQSKDVTLKRIINVPPRGIGETTIEKLNDFAKVNEITFAESCRRWREQGIIPKAGEGIDGLLYFLSELPKKMVAPGSNETSFLEVFREMGYREYVYSLSDDASVGERKWGLVEIFARILFSFLEKNGMNLFMLKEFLDRLMLRDEMLAGDEEENKVQLMTLHASKGLEFPVVMLCGIEEDLLPHKNLGQDVDEERRLFYVGITRAQEILLMTKCLERKRNGAFRKVAMSRFLLDANPELYKIYPRGVRPVSGEKRTQLVSDFLKSLDAKKL
ncbi:MAG: ATP-dependent DNA helicase [Bdellovibrio sp. 28-41-41]|nr:MAG: ATP-dependent DNA helicase [Bdellovibrio sp. 28-41-41]